MALAQEPAEKNRWFLFFCVDKNRPNHLSVKIDHLSKTAYIKKKYLL